MSPFVPCKRPGDGLGMAALLLLEAPAYLAVELDHRDSRRSDLVEYRIVCRTDHNEGSGMPELDQLPQPGIEHRAVLEVAQAAADDADAQHVVFGEGVEAVAPGLLRAPTGVDDGRDAALDGAMLDDAHLVKLDALDGLGEVGVGAEVDAKDTVKVAGDFVEEPPLLPDSLALAVEPLVVDVAVDVCIDVVVAETFGHFALVGALRLVPGDDGGRHLLCRRGYRGVVELRPVRAFIEHAGAPTPGVSRLRRYTSC